MGAVTRSRARAVTQRRVSFGPSIIHHAPESKGFVHEVLDFCTDREHGTKANQVPAAWRAHHSLCSLYALSSFAYCVFGIFFLTSIPKHGRLYDLEALEGLLYIWQGFASFQCDAVDLGVPSISHPVDRVSACGFLLWQIGKYTLFAARGSLGPRALATFPVCLLAGLYTFYRSAKAVDANDREGYFRWHTIWHFAFPVASLIHYGGHWGLF